MTVSELQAGRVGEARAETIRTGLLGRGIMASRSPWMHEAEAKAQGLSLTYELFDFTELGWADEDLGAKLVHLRDQGFAGVNITHPFKQLAIRNLDSLAPSAQAVGAVNTVRFEHGRSIGHNTDVSGFAASLNRGLAGQSLNHVIQFGSGGAGSATAHALLSLGTMKLFLVDEDQAKAKALAAALAKAHPAAVIETISRSAASFSDACGIVNATPVGMAAHPGLPFDPSQLRADQWVADIVYFPIETELLRAARALGCPTLDGKGMAVFQAAEAFRIFTGCKADGARMMESFDAFVPGNHV